MGLLKRSGVVINPQTPGEEGADTLEMQVKNNNETPGTWVDRVLIRIQGVNYVGSSNF